MGLIRVQRRCRSSVGGWLVIFWQLMRNFRVRRWAGIGLQ